MYYPRICDKVLAKKLQLTGATLVVGPKCVGKLKHHFKQLKVLFIYNQTLNIRRQVN